MALNIVNLVGKKIEQIALRRGRQMFNYVCQRLDRFNKVPINFFPIAELVEKEKAMNLANFNFNQFS